MRQLRHISNYSHTPLILGGMTQNQQQQQPQQHLLSLHHYDNNNKVANAFNSISRLMAAHNATPVATVATVAAANATITRTTQPQVAKSSTSTSTGKVLRGGVGVVDWSHHRADYTVFLLFATHLPVSIITLAIAAAVSSTGAQVTTTTTTTTAKRSRDERDDIQQRWNDDVLTLEIGHRTKGCSGRTSHRHYE